MYMANLISNSKEEEHK